MEKTIAQLEKEKDECYLRPEKYQFERADKLIKWANAILKFNKKRHNEY